MRKFWNVALTCLLLLSWPGLMAPPAASAASVVIADYGFENNTAQGWSQMGSGSLAAVSQDVYASHGGSYSLLTSGRTAAWNAPSLNVTPLLKAGGVYSISAYVRAALPADAGKLKITVKRTADGSDHYDQVTDAASVAGSGWVKLEGSYTYSAASSLLLYIESDQASAPYLIDDVRIEETAAPAPGGDPGNGGGEAVAIHTDYEDGTLQGWASRTGTEKVAVVADTAQSGSRSLLITERPQSYAGPALDLTDRVHAGSKYRISAWAKLADPAASAELRLSLQADSGGKTSYLTAVGNTTVTGAQWVHLTGDYVISAAFDTLSIYVESASGTDSFYLDHFELDSLTTLPVQTSLASVYQAYSGYFPVGVEVEPGEVTGEHGKLLALHFNSIVAGNSMKWDATEPQENQFVFEGRGDVLADYARANGIGMRGHTLLWHQQVPDWLFKHADGTDLTGSEEDKALLRSRLENHIKHVVQHFNDVVYTWDVVNEVIDETQPDGFRRSKWYQILGPEYIDDAFLYAKKYVKPGATLIINDYGTTNVKKRQFLYNLVKDMKARGIPVDGVGHQMHNTVEGPSPAEIRQTMEMFAGLGVENQVTELDVSVYPNDSASGYSSLPQELALRQAYYYRDMFRTFKTLKTTAHLTGVTLWGMADDNSWLSKPERTDYPLLFDHQLQAKPAYYGVAAPGELPVLNRTLTISRGTPVVDGRTETLWDAISPVSVQTEDGNSAGAFKAMWDEGNLYVYAEAEDASYQSNDRIELFLDADNAKSKSYDANDRRLTLNRSGSGTDGIVYRVYERSGGYAVEAKIPLAGAAGKKIGYDLRMTNAGTGASASWNDFTGRQEQDPSQFGTLVYGDALKLGEAAPAAPAVDGAEDAAWAAAPEYRTAVPVQGTDGAAASFKVLWNADRLYVFAHVQDSHLSKASANAYEQDSIEIFVDPDNGKTSYYGAEDGQYRVNFDNEQSYGGAASASNFTAKTRVTDAGYDVEAAIQLPSAAAAGQLIGFDLQVNDDGDGDGVRDHVMIWSDPSGQSWQNTSKWGTLLLKAPASASETASPAPSASAPAASRPANTGEIQLASGGTLTLNGATLVFPAGAMDNGVLRVTVSKVTNTGNLVLAAGQKLAGDVYDLSKDRTGNFVKPVTLTLPFDPSRLSKGEQAGLYTYDETARTWSPLEKAVVNPERATVTAAVYHFSKYAVLAVAPSAAVVPAAPELKDLKGHWAAEAVSRLIERGALHGYPDHTFRPDAAITRAEFTSLLVQAFKLSAAQSAAFTDTRGHWAEAAIGTAAAFGITEGYEDGTFRPAAPLTREQMAVMTARAAKLSSGASGPDLLSFRDGKAVSAWAKAPLAALLASGKLSGYPDGTLRPGAAASRAEAAVLVAGLLPQS
ncbi:endo-1,4-beta-xylanase [Paenibacillus glufosinatiresistens]|uniref:endo-1,4-beta-xylanase n=1 Tax=Paenibacillus glufosinatiresistens TaxID=3070657 RepID=UPI00286E9E3D|nr:endo-1,4-beta-xylanase [Paenibacillus sp. YX.27]